MYSAETISRIEQLRALSRERKLTLEESQEAVKLIRQDRVGASYASSGAKAKKAAAAPRDGASVLDKLMQGMLDV
jgi:hypothetical protein